MSSDKVQISIAIKCNVPSNKAQGSSDKMQNVSSDKVQICQVINPDMSSYEVQMFQSDDKVHNYVKQ